MKIKINVTWLFLVFFSVLSFAPVQALDSIRDQAIEVRTTEVVPLSVSVGDAPDENSLLVELFAAKAIGPDSQVRFSWYDDAGDVVGNYSVGLKQSGFIGLETVRIPRLDFIGDYSLQANVFSANGVISGSGKTDYVADSGSQRLKLGAPSVVRGPEGFTIGFTAQNYNLSQSVVPRLQIFYIRNNERQYVLQRKGEILELGSREEAKIDFLVATELPAGQYYAEAWLESVSGRYLSGVAEAFVPMPGSYAQLANVQVDFDGTRAKEAVVSVEGFALVPEGENLKLQIESLHNETVLAKEVMSVPVVEGYFTEKIDLSFPEAVSQFSGKLDLFTGDSPDLGELLLAQSFESPSVVPVVDEPVASVEKTESSVTESTPSVSSIVGQLPWMYVLLGAAALLLLILIFIFGMHKKSKKVFGWLLLGGISFLFFSGGVNAAQWEVIFSGDSGPECIDYLGDIPDCSEEVSDGDPCSNIGAHCKDFTTTSSVNGGYSCSGYEAICKPDANDSNSCDSYANSAACENNGCSWQNSASGGSCSASSTSSTADTECRYDVDNREEVETEYCYETDDDGRCSGSESWAELIWNGYIVESDTGDVETLPVEFQNYTYRAGALRDTVDNTTNGSNGRQGSLYEYYEVCSTPKSANPTEPVSDPEPAPVSSGSTGDWTIGDWSECVPTCGDGEKTRVVTCAFDSCNGAKPNEVEPCNNGACNTCTDTVWAGEDPADICVGRLARQSKCDEVRTVPGTWAPVDYGPSSSLACSFDTIYQATSCGETREVQGTLDCSPVWQWLRPTTPKQLVSANSDSAYNNLRVSGDLYYSIAGKGFFEVNDPILDTRIVLLDGTNEYEYQIPQSEITYGDRAYDFIVDLAELQEQVPAGESEPVIFADGENWNIDVYFQHQHDGLSAPRWIKNSISGEFELDSSAPQVVLVSKKNDGVPFADGEISNQPGVLSIQCQDVGPAGCLGDAIDLTSTGYKDFVVKGNFCDDPEICDDQGARQFEICDLAGNCVIESVSLQNYDPISPTSNSFAIDLAEGESFLRTIFKASANYFPALEYVDPRTVETGVPGVTGRTAYLTETEFATLFDANACGSAPADPFRFDPGETNAASDDLCVLRNTNYAPPCEADGSCPDACGDGFVWDAGLGRCANAPTCQANQWTPSVNTVCSGEPFEQVSNCGTRQTVFGTKDCSEVASANSCSAQTVTTPDGSCTHSVGNEGDKDTCTYGESASVGSCRVGYQFQKDNDDSPLLYTPFSSLTTGPKLGNWSITTSDKGNDDDTCNSSGCGVNLNAQCETDGFQIRVGYQYRMNNQNSVKTFTEWTKDNQISVGAISSLVFDGKNDHECHPDRGGCGLSIEVETDDPNVTCDIRYRHRNDEASSDFASNGAWATFSNKSGGGEECDESPGCGLQVELNCIDNQTGGSAGAGSSTGSITSTCVGGTWVPEGSYTGTWTANAAPSCPTACGTAATTQTGTVTCSDGNCDPATKPSANARNCSATAACGPTITCTDNIRYEWDGWVIPGGACNDVNFAVDFCQGYNDCTISNVNRIVDTEAVCNLTYTRCDSGRRANTTTYQPPTEPPNPFPGCAAGAWGFCAEQSDCSFGSECSGGCCYESVGGDPFR